MSIHLVKDIDAIKSQLVELSVKVEQSIQKSIRSLVLRDTQLADKVVCGDKHIDELEVQIEQQCLKVLALHQPVAADLRYIVVVLKVNNDLERMGDLAANIASRAKKLSAESPLSIGLDISNMAVEVCGMVRQSLDSLLHGDTALARDVLKQDDSVDELNRQNYELLRNSMIENSETVCRAIHLLAVSRHLERIADLATNIAEDVVFMEEGELIRHGLVNNESL